MAAEKNRSSKLASVESNMSRKHVNVVESNNPSAELLATIKSLNDKVASITKLETSVSYLQKELEMMRKPKDDPRNYETRCFERDQRADQDVFGRGATSEEGRRESFFRSTTDNRKGKFQNDGKFDDGKKFGSRQSNETGRDSRYTASCKTCAEEGKDRCFHCKKCGGLNHYAKHCLQSSKGMGLLRKGDYQ